jgi:hypothetical protein
MSIQGELAISLTRNADGLESTITSSRPMHATQLFEGKTIEQTLQILPLLFNICANAQAVTAVRSIESALKLPSNDLVESQREVLVAIESLREQSLQVLMQWPSFIGESLNNGALSDIVQSLNKLILTFKPKQLLRCGADKVNPITDEQRALWIHCQAHLNTIIFNSDHEVWQQNNLDKIDHWAQAQQTQAARFLDWLSQQCWKDAGRSDIKPLPDINDGELAQRMKEDQQQFTAQPDWKTSCYEASWFNYQQTHPVIRQLRDHVGNGIYTRSIARLIEIATLMNTLQDVFLSNTILTKPVSLVEGLANTYAARGRLSHYVELEDRQIKHFYILAPTEWNFHPQGVAVEGLRQLQHDDMPTLQLQANLLIHAIDPCVGYQLHIKLE